MTARALIKPTDLERIIRGVRKAGVRAVAFEWPDGTKLVIPTDESEHSPVLSPESPAPQPEPDEEGVL